MSQACRGQKGTGAPKLGARLAEQIQAEILRGDHPVGHRLGGELDLMVRYGVSRSTLREAIRQLEAFGAVRMKRGGGGGLVVADGPAQLAANAVTTYLALVDLEWDELFDVRIALEASAAGLASRRASEAEVRQLRSLGEALDPTRPQAEVVAAHVATRNLIARICGNAAISLFVTAFNRFTFDVVSGQLGETDFQAQAGQAAVHKRRIIEAIVAKNSMEAQSAAVEELQKRRDALRPVRLAARCAETWTVRGPEAAIRAGVGYTSKLGHRLAVRIARELGGGLHRAGERLGLEADLARRYQVSRAVLREAVHILEAHGLIDARRGRQGGLFAGKPEPEHTVRLAAAYLKRLGLAPKELEEARASVAILAASLAARRGSPEQKSDLQTLLAAQLAARGDDRTRTAMAVQRQVAEMSGNRAVELIIKVLMGAETSDPPHPLPEAIVGELQTSHERLVAAIVSGDEALAQRRMVQHVKQARRWLEALDAHGPEPAFERGAA